LKKQIFFFVLFLVCCLTAKTQYQHLLHKTHAQRVPLLLAMYHGDLISQDSAVLFTKINAIYTLAADNGDDDLLMEAALLRAHYFYYRDRPPALVLSILDSLRMEGIRRKKIWVEALAQNMMALYCFDRLKQYEVAFGHHRKVYTLVKDLDPEVFPNKQNCLLQMASEYYFFRDFRQSLFLSLEALNAGTHPAFAAYFHELSLMNTAGLCYQKLGMLDSAAYYFNETILLAKQHNKPEWVGIASGNLGNNYFLEKQYEAAIPLLQKDVELAVQYRDWGLASGSLMTLASISFDRSQVVEAAGYLISARDYVYRSGSYERLQDLYPLLAKLYALQGNGSGASVFIDSALFVRDSVSRKLNALQMLRAKQQIDLEQQHAELDNIRNQKRISLLERNILVSVVVLMMAGALFFYRQQRKRSAKQKREIRKGREELADAARQLEEFARNISEKNTMLALLRQNGNDNQEVLQQLQQSTILTDQDWEHFRRLFEKVHNGFLSRLKEKIPGLTPAETRFIALSKLDLSNKEMAGMLGIGTDAIRQYRSRLKKKLHLDEEKNLEEIVAEV
jgi:DNA-binding CsgD family transcriptional regulator